MWACCGLGPRKKLKEQQQQQQQPDERTALLDPDILPFVQPSAPRLVDDDALLEYQRRIDRILEEASEKIANVSTTAQMSHARSTASEASGSTFSIGPHGQRRRQQRGSASTEGGSNSRDIAGLEHDRDRESTWRAEQNTQGLEDGSIYSMKKVAKPRSSKGKKTRKPNGVPEEGSQHSASDHEAGDAEDPFGTVATYRTAESGDTVMAGEESGDNTPTGHRSSKGSTTKITKAAKGSRKNVQDVFADEGAISSTQKSPQDDLSRALAMSEADFTKFLTQPA